MKPYKKGYTIGVFDLFHIGHLNILEQSKKLCERLIVGIKSDELVKSHKGKNPVITLDERLAIVSAIRHVDEAVVLNERDMLKAWEKHRFDAIFAGGDWKGSDDYSAVAAALKPEGVDIIFFPYTQTTSSTLLTKTLLRLSEELGNQ